MSDQVESDSGRVIRWTLFASIGCAVIVFATDDWKFDFSNPAWGPIGSALVAALVGVFIKPAFDRDMARLQAGLQASVLGAIEDKKSDALAKLEVRKHELQLLIERHKAEHQRIVDKSKTASAIHFRLLPKLYEQLRIAEGTVNRWYGFHTAPDIMRMSTDDFRGYIDWRYAKVNQNERDRVVDTFDKGLRGEALEKQVSNLHRLLARHQIQRVTRLLYRNELFLSRDTFGIAEKALMALSRAAEMSKWVGIEELDHLWDDGKEGFRLAGDALAELRNVARRTLGIETIEPAEQRAGPVTDAESKK